MRKKAITSKDKIAIVGGFAILVCLIVSLLLLEQIPRQLPAQSSKELKLSDFPEAFRENTLIVVGDNAPERELQVAEDIANYLKNKTGNKPKIKKFSKITTEDRRNYNLIIIGTPKSNKMLGEIYKISDVLEVNESFPGEGKGIVEILPNPWNGNKAMLLVEGNDAVGVNIMGQITFQTEKIHLKQVYGPYEGKKSETGMIGLPNPSAVYCENLGYRYEIRTKSDGSQLGFCIFDGEECPAWDFFNGLCGEEYTYCSKMGGILIIIKSQYSHTSVYAACILSSGKICYEFDYAMGACK